MKMKKILGLDVFSKPKNPKYRDEVLKRIDDTNALRARVLTILIAILEVAIILGFDIYNITTNGWSGNNAGLYFVIHLFLLNLGVLGAIVSHYYIHNKENRIFKKISFEVLVTIGCGLYLIGISVIHGLDQLYNVDNSMLLFNLIIISLFALNKPKNFILMIITVYITFLGTMILFQDDTRLFVSTIINGTLAIITASIIAFMNYYFYYDYISKSIELEYALKKLEVLSITDELTGVYNRRKLEENLREELSRASRGQGVFTLLLLDIDDFKKVNDSQGHLVGDEVLKNLTKILKSNLRSIDTLSRYGGEEFCIILTNTTLSQGIEKGEELRKRIKDSSDDMMKQITISIGVSVYQQNDTIDSIIHRADQALYDAKDAGKNIVKSK